MLTVALTMQRVKAKVFFVHVLWRVFMCVCSKTVMAAVCMSEIGSCECHGIEYIHMFVRIDLYLECNVTKNVIT